MTNESIPKNESRRGFRKSGCNRELTGNSTVLYSETFWRFEGSEFRERRHSPSPRSKLGNSGLTKIF
jgi:hypothetical protein